MLATPSHDRAALPWTFDDGGRARYGYGSSSTARDCVVRAITIAGLLSYWDIFHELFERQKHWAERGRSRAARHMATHKDLSPLLVGVHPEVWKPYIAELGWSWVPVMGIGSGTTAHLAPGEIPDGRLVVRCSRHLVAVIDGVIRDTHDPARGGTRAVYGYYVAA